MWEIPYICFLIFILVTFRLRLRMVDKRFAERIRVARELQDTMLQTIQGSKLVVDHALEKSDDAVDIRLTLESLSTWLGQATQEGQAALNALNTSDPKKS